MNKLLNKLIKRKKPIFINGKWLEGAGREKISTINPTTNKIISTIGSASIDQVETACNVAAEAFKHWRQTSGMDRAKYLDDIADGLASRKSYLIELQMLNNGKPRHEAEFDLDDAIACFHYYAKLAEDMDEKEPLKSLSDSDFKGGLKHEPIGPVGLIVPWNFPLVTSAWKIAPALAAGCTLVLKNSEITPLVELAYGDIAKEINLPNGVLNIVTGFADVGEALTTNTKLHKLSFTGSNAVGSIVMSKAAEKCQPISLELGGKSPIIVLPDADIDKAVELIIGGIFTNCGQMCSATSRLIVDKSISEKLLQKLKTETETIVVDSPTNSNCQMGPITNRAQFNKVNDFIKRANDDKIDCLTGGKVVEEITEHSDNGLFITPTIYTDVPSDHFLWREEIFGPVLSVQTFESIDEAIEIANDTEFGLVGTVVAKDEKKAIAVANRIDAGHVWVNSPQVILPESIWGGFKASGIGRELGPSGLESYQEKKFMTIGS